MPVYFTFRIIEKLAIFKIFFIERWMEQNPYCMEDITVSRVPFSLKMQGAKNKYEI